MTASNTPLSRYCHWLAGFFFIDGMDRDDIYQEASLAAWLASPGLERVAARRRVIELLRRSKRGGRPTFCELAEMPLSADVIDLVTARETLRRVLATPLSELERVALGRAIRGESVTESKAIDNALWRARRKLAAKAEVKNERQLRREAKKLAQLAWLAEVAS